ncbi:MAG: hypothetical protein ACPL07_01240 [Candidatus Bathyarchaeia archaeon]
MRKIVFIHKYGRNAAYSICLVDDNVAEKVLRLSRAKMFDLAYEVALQNDLSNESQKRSKDWDSLKTVDIMLAYFRRHHARKEW